MCLPFNSQSHYCELTRFYYIQIRLTEHFKLHKTLKGLEVPFNLSKQSTHTFCMLKTQGSDSVSLQFHTQVISLMSMGYLSSAMVSCQRRFKLCIRKERKPTCKRQKTTRKICIDWPLQNRVNHHLILRSAIALMVFGTKETVTVCCRSHESNISSGAKGGGDKMRRWKENGSSSPPREP